MNLFALSQNSAGLTAEEVEVSGNLDFSVLSEDEMLDLLTLHDKIKIVAARFRPGPTTGSFSGEVGDYVRVWY